MAHSFMTQFLFLDIYFDAFINGVWYEKSRRCYMLLNSYIRKNVFSTLTNNI